jgi:arginine-tRNA-protein transferase
VEIGDVRIDEAVEAMFEAHKRRFIYGVPESIFDFLSPADESPSDVRQLSVYEGDRMVAASFFDVGAAAMSGVYAVFDPVEAGRSLGIFTLLKEIEFAAAAGLEYYYLGYSYEDASFYDYKKRFRASEVFDWESGWEPFSASSSL